MATQRPLISFSVGLVKGVMAEVFLNGLPVIPHLLHGPKSLAMMCNERLIQGSNELSLRIMRSPCTYQREVSVTISQVLDDTVRPMLAKELYACDFPALLAEVEGAERRTPYHHVATFEVDADIHRNAWLDAPKMTVNHDGSAELHAAVDDILQAMATRDAERLLQRMRFRFEEEERCYEGHDMFAASHKEHEWRAFLQGPVEVAPRDPKELNYEPLCDGRVVYVRPYDHGCALLARRSDMPELTVATNFLMMRHEDRWCAL